MIRSEKTFSAIFDLYYTSMRSHLLETAAALDRLARYDTENQRFRDPRYQKLQQALAILADSQDSKAERFLDAFSVPENEAKDEVKHVRD